MVRLCSALYVFAVSGCGLILDFDPPDMVPGSFDASIDGDVIADSGVDAWIDPDTENDAGLLPPDPCDDELGLCIRYHAPDGLLILGYQSNMYWTEGGVTVESGWTLETCLGGLRTVAPNVYDCLFHAIPVPPSRVIYYFPLTPAGPACDASRCSGFPDAWEYWLNAVPVSGTPGAGPVSMERRPTPYGMIMAIRFTT